MKIISLEIENVKKIKAASIQPKDNVVTIQGENGAGKSSVLDSIVMALRGGKSIPEQPITVGADKGGIKMEFEDFTVIRTFTKKGSYLKIESKDGSNIKSPQEFLDKLVGQISFDPLAFINQDEKKQRKVLMELIGIDVDELDKMEKEVFDERTIKGRELKAAEIKVKGLKKWGDVTETEEVKVSELVGKLEEARKFNKEIEDRIQANNKRKEIAIKEQGEIDKKRQLIKELENDIFELENDIINKKHEFKTEKAAIAELEPVDLETINSEIKNIEEKNAKIRDNNKAKEEEKAFKAVKSQYDEIDKNLNKIRQEKIDKLKSANIPVSGLSFSDSGLTYNNIPLSQCSDGEKLMVSMGISMALNPTMRVLRIKDGSLLGPKNLKILSDMVKEKDFQIFIEKVSDYDQYNASGKVGIFIEDGGVIAIDGVMAEEVKKDKKNKEDKKTKEDKKEAIEKKNTKEDDDDW